MKILSLFDGMSCGRIALDRAGIHVYKYYASEIDKYAQIVSSANYPDIIRLGDITKWQEWQIEKPDMIIAGSPCQGFSFAGKQLNFNDPRSALFFTFVEILKHYKPKYFLLENVIMKAEYNDVISGILGELYPECVAQKEIFRTGRLEPIEINSALLSAQNRRRLYWTNIQGIEQPKDKGIFLKDIIEEATTEKEKAYCIDANYFKGSSVENYIDKSRRQMVKCGAIRGRNPEKPTSRDSGLDTVQMLEIRDDEKTNCLTSVQKDNVVCYGQNYIQFDPNLAMNNSTEYRIYYKTGKAGTIAKSHSTIPNIKESESDEKIMYRKLTPTECEMLQTVPYNYTAHVSNSQRYKMLGNGWTVDVIAHIFRSIK